MKVALIHDHLTQAGGAEKVLEVMSTIWPEAPIYTLFFDSQKFPEFKEKKIRTSFLQKLPLALKKYQWYLPLMPIATERHDLRGYDIVISSSSAFSKGVILDPDALHICYCHSPTRYLWSDTHSYVKELRLPRAIKSLLPPLLSQLRMWDKHASDRVDYFLANSKTVSRRITRYYNRDSSILYPPVDIDRFEISKEPKEYFLAGGRIVAYKRFDLIVEAANQTGIPVKIFGKGPLLDELRSKARPNVEFLGRVSDEQLAKLYANAKAYLHPQVEDFGITPVESMASGRPVIAYGKGGAAETVKEGVSGELFHRQSWEEIADRMIRFNEDQYQPENIREHALQFSTQRFSQQLKNIVAQYRP